MTADELSGRHSSTVSCYSVNNDTWRTLASMKTHRSSHVTVTHGKNIIIMNYFIV